MRLASDTLLWNGNRSQVWVGEKEVVTTDIAPASKIQAILDENHANRREGHNRKAFGRLAARIPDVLFYEWQKEWRTTYRKDWTWQTYLAMKISSGEHKKFLTTHLKRFV